MKILFVWTGLTSYMADCWRALQAHEGVEIEVIIATRPEDGVDFKPDALLKGIDCHVVPSRLPLTTVVKRPDVIFLVGWHNPVCRFFALAPEYADVPKIMTMDMPWRWQLRCLVAPLFLRRYVRRFDAVYVPGVMAARYARWLGGRKVQMGQYAINTERFAPTSPCDTPSYFLYIGRGATEKRLDVLAAGYRTYRAQGGRLPLRCYGKGDFSPLFGIDGIELHSFVDPEQIPSLMHGAVALVLTSDFDPWPLVLLEAMSAGCPVIASDRCNNRPELGKEWLVFPHGKGEALSVCLAEQAKRSLEMQGKARGPSTLIQEYDCRAWVGRTFALARKVMR